MPLTNSYSGEETKFGLNKEELEKLISGIGPNDGKTSRTCIRGLMGMASFTKDETVVKNEFATLRSLFNLHRNDPVFNNEFSILSMGMSADYRLAIDAGSTLVRIGSLLFGSRQG